MSFKVFHLIKKYNEKQYLIYKEYIFDNMMEFYLEKTFILGLMNELILCPKIAINQGTLNYGSANALNIF